MYILQTEFHIRHSILRICCIFVCAEHIVIGRILFDSRNETCFAIKSSSKLYYALVFGLLFALVPCHGHFSTSWHLTKNYSSTIVAIEIPRSSNADVFLLCLFLIPSFLILLFLCWMIINLSSPLFAWTVSRCSQGWFFISFWYYNSFKWI